MVGHVVVVVEIVVAHGGWDNCVVEGHDAVVCEGLQGYPSSDDFYTHEDVQDDGDQDGCPDGHVVYHYSEEDPFRGDGTP